MKKFFITSATILCCWVMAAMFSACNDNYDNPTPSEDVNKGIVIDLDSIVIKPYLLFGASLADVEKYMAENFADWTYNKPDSLDDEESFFDAIYLKDNKVIRFTFKDAPTGNLIFSDYIFFSKISFPAIKAELERKGFTYEGVLKFEGYDADECYMFLSADKTIEVQFCRWFYDDCWLISFQAMDESDLNYLEPA